MLGREVLKNVRSRSFSLCDFFLCLYMDSIKHSWKCASNYMRNFYSVITLHLFVKKTLLIFSLKLQKLITICSIRNKGSKKASYSKVSLFSPYLCF